MSFRISENKVRYVNVHFDEDRFREVVDKERDFIMSKLDEMEGLADLLREYGINVKAKIKVDNKKLDKMLFERVNDYFTIE